MNSLRPALDVSWWDVPAVLPLPKISVLRRGIMNQEYGQTLQELPMGRQWLKVTPWQIVANAPFSTLAHYRE